jgi:dipeptidyl aminopeptidase/acylaminoacyl peptidase
MTTKTAVTSAIGIGLMCLAVVPLLAQQFANSQSTISEEAGRIVITRPHSYLGDGAALSFDGKLLAYIGEDNGLYLRDLAHKSEQLLVREVDGGLTVFSGPNFSSNGEQLYFAASGGTSSYPSNIYVVTLANGTIRQVTHAVRNGESQADQPGRPYKEYFSTPLASPDGSGRVLVRERDAVLEKDFMAVVDESSGNVTTLAEGTPIGWTSSGMQAYCSTQDGVELLNIAGGSVVRVLSGDGARVVGLVSDSIVEVQDHLVFSRSGGSPIALRLDGVRQVSTGGTGVSKESLLPLRQVQQTPDGRHMLAVYDDGTTEQIVISSSAQQ